jgi:hybrid cluster-associated redox disulfide protein
MKHTCKDSIESPLDIGKISGGNCMTFTKEMLIGEMLEEDPAIAEILMSAGMHCITCEGAQMESLEEACFVHGINCDALLEYINGYEQAKEIVASDPVQPAGNEEAAE